MVLYAVLNIKKSVLLQIGSKDPVLFPVNGIYGYLPIFETYEQAIIESNKGEFEILTIETTNEQ